MRLNTHPQHSAQASNQPEGPVNFSAGLLDLTGSHPRRTGPTFRRQAVSFRPSSAGHVRDQATWQQEVPWRRKRCGGAASATSPMRLVCEDVRRKSRESASTTSVQFRVNSVVTRCVLPLPRRAAYGAVPLGNGMATPGHFLLRRSFPVHHPRLTPAAPAALRCPWNGDEAAHARRLPAPEFELASTPRRPRHAR